MKTTRLTREDLQIAIVQQSAIMQALDLVDKSDCRAWTAGRSALSLLARATVLAELLAHDD